MKPFRDYDLRQVIANQWAAVNKKIDTMSNEEIMANDLDVLAENIYQEFFIEPVTIFEEDFSKRSIKQGKIQKYIDPFFREADLFKCRASTFSMGVYPEITVNKATVSFRIERSLSEMNNAKAKDSLLGSLEQALKEIRDGLSYANNDVAAFNNSLKQQAMKWLEEKKKKVEAYFSIATMFEVPIEKKEYAQTHIPLKRHIVPVAKHYETSNYYGILDGDYKDILDSIKHTGSTYERTPSSYKTLHEEDLRNTLLAALNATYKGDATGETFRNRGKTDICIERDNRTWRDCKTALIYFVRRKDFLKTLESAEAALRAYDGMRNVVSLDKNEFECLFLSKANPGQQIKMRVMLFNLYCED